MQSRITSAVKAYMNTIMCTLLKVVTASVTILSFVAGHGRFIEPPSRASAWRFGFDTPADYTDNGRNCGGKSFQWANGGKCGFCGDPFDGPRPHEAGGKYATGTIVRTYKMNQQIKTGVQITANHKGWFEFRLCKNDNPATRVTQECLDKHLLKTPEGNSRLFIGTDNKIYSHTLQLPQDLTCSQCVIQWKWHGGNNHGNEQEEFYGCADVAIVNSNQASEEKPFDQDEDEDSVGYETTGDEYGTTPDSDEDETNSEGQAANSPQKYCMSKAKSLRSDKWCTTNCIQTTRKCKKECQCFSKKSKFIMKVLMRYMELIDGFRGSETE